MVYGSFDTDKNAPIAAHSHWTRSQLSL